jgi:hypothetical protein
MNIEEQIFKINILESQKMQRFRLSTNFIQFTSPSETIVNSDYESDNQPDQRLGHNSEVIRVGNLLDQVSFSFFSKVKQKEIFIIF